MGKTKGIEINPRIMFGKPVVAGTRIPVEIILDRLVAGETIKNILRDYPRLKIRDIRAALNFANKLVRQISPDDAQTFFHKISH